ncbi:hypothetical protein ACA910_011455 [Epithemia clementina (nom. ined.)]
MAQAWIGIAAGVFVSILALGALVAALIHWRRNQYLLQMQREIDQRSNHRTSKTSSNNKKLKQNQPQQLPQRHCLFLFHFQTGNNNNASAASVDDCGDEENGSHDNDGGSVSFEQSSYSTVDYDYPKEHRHNHHHKTSRNKDNSAKDPGSIVSSACGTHGDNHTREDNTDGGEDDDVLVRHRITALGFNLTPSRLVEEVATGGSRSRLNSSSNDSRSSHSRSQYFNSNVLFHNYHEDSIERGDGLYNTSCCGSGGVSSLRRGVFNFGWYEASDSGHTIRENSKNIQQQGDEEVEQTESGADDDDDDDDENDLFETITYVVQVPASQKLGLVIHSNNNFAMSAAAGATASLYHEKKQHQQPQQRQRSALTAAFAFFNRRGRRRDRAEHSEGVSPTSMSKHEAPVKKKSKKNNDWRLEQYPVVQALKESSVLRPQGVRVGDYLVQLNDQSVKGMTATQVSKYVQQKQRQHHNQQAACNNGKDGRQARVSHHPHHHRTSSDDTGITVSTWASSASTMGDPQHNNQAMGASNYNVKTTASLASASVSTCAFAASSFSSAVDDDDCCCTLVFLRRQLRQCNVSCSNNNASVEYSKPMPLPQVQNQEQHQPRIPLTHSALPSPLASTATATAAMTSMAASHSDELSSILKDKGGITGNEENEETKHGRKCNGNAPCTNVCTDVEATKRIPRAEDVMDKAMPTNYTLVAPPTPFTTT